MLRYHGAAMPIICLGLCGPGTGVWLQSTLGGEEYPSGWQAPLSHVSTSQQIHHLEKAKYMEHIFFKFLVLLRQEKEIYITYPVISLTTYQARERRI